MIFPEGATTNNKSIIQFKKGPFGGLNSVLPIALKYWSVDGISLQNDTVGLNHFYYSYMSMGYTLNMKIFPVFKPNEYFFEHHWNKDSGE